MEIGVFGFGQPVGLFAAIGLAARDVTLDPAGTLSAANDLIEPFMDPFAASVLNRLAAGGLNGLAAVVFLRESPGAVHAYHYAREFERRGLLPQGAPAAILLNIVPSDTPAAKRFNLSEIARLRETLGALGWRPGDGPSGRADALDALIAAQSEGRITGAAAFDMRRNKPADPAPPSAPPGPRLALLGAPMGNSTLHARLDEIGLLALDQQALDQARAAQGAGIDDALRCQADNPFAARQPRDVFADAIGAELARHRIEHVYWQVDPHDDLWGWLAPQVRALCTARGIGFTDLGFLPRWPGPGDIAL